MTDGYATHTHMQYIHAHTYKLTLPHTCMHMHTLTSAHSQAHTHKLTLPHTCMHMCTLISSHYHWAHHPNSFLDEVVEVESQRSSNISTESRPVSGEMRGQLYAYRVNSSAVYLGTRNAAELGAAIGLGETAQGTYSCVARNENARRSVNITVQVNGMH